MRAWSSCGKNRVRPVWLEEARQSKMDSKMEALIGVLEEFLKQRQATDARFRALEQDVGTLRRRLALVLLTLLALLLASAWSVISGAA